jgi:hypothetical protein
MAHILFLIPLLWVMSYAELCDWIDYVDYYYLSEWITDVHQQGEYKLAIRVRRTRLATGSFPSQSSSPKIILQMQTHEQIQAAKLMAEADEAIQKAALALAQAILRMKDWRRSKV